MPRRGLHQEVWRETGQGKPNPPEPPGPALTRAAPRPHPALPCPHRGGANTRSGRAYCQWTGEKRRGGTSRCEVTALVTNGVARSGAVGGSASD